MAKKKTKATPKAEPEAEAVVKAPTLKESTQALLDAIDAKGLRGQIGGTIVTAVRTALTK